MENMSELKWNPKQYILINIYLHGHTKQIQHGNIHEILHLLFALPQIGIDRRYNINVMLLYVYIDTFVHTKTEKYYQTCNKNSVTLCSSKTASICIPKGNVSCHKQRLHIHAHMCAD